MKKVFCIKAMLFLAVLTALLFMAAISWKEVYKSTSLSIVDLTLICFLHLVFLVLGAKRLHILLSVYSMESLSFSRWFRIYMSGTLINRIFPQAGNFYRGFELKRLANICYSGYLGALLWLSWIDILLCIAIAFLLILLGHTIIGGGWYVGALIGALVSVGVMPFVLMHVARSFSQISVAKKIRSTLMSLELAIQPLFQFQHLNRVSSVCALGVVGILLMAYRLWLGFEVFGIYLEPADLFLLFAIYKMTTLMLITPGNLGVQEISIAGLSELLGYGFSEGILASLLLRFCGYLSLAIAWVVMLWFPRNV